MKRITFIVVATTMASCVGFNVSAQPSVGLHGHRPSVGHPAALHGHRPTHRAPRPPLIYANPAPPVAHHRPPMAYHQTPAPPIVYGSSIGAGPDHNFYRGQRISPYYRSNQYVVTDYQGHHLNAPPRGYQWVQLGADYAMIAIATGIIAQILIGQ